MKPRSGTPKIEDPSADLIEIVAQMLNAPIVTYVDLHRAMLAGISTEEIIARLPLNVDPAMVPELMFRLPNMLGYWRWKAWSGYADG